VVPSKSNSFIPEKEKDTTILKCLNNFLHSDIKENRNTQDLQKPLKRETVITIVLEYVIIFPHLKL
jgi:hypothetical protein